MEWQEPNELRAVRRLARRLQREAGEGCGAATRPDPPATPCSDSSGLGIVICVVVAPSLTPVKPGSRIKTDQRDARKLAELLRAGLLTEVHPPSESDEALRDLCRCRDSVRDDLLRARHRLGKFLLRRHSIFSGSKHHWGTRHMRWLEQLRFDDRSQPGDVRLATSWRSSSSRSGSGASMRSSPSSGTRNPTASRSAGCAASRGIDTVTAVSLVAELHDFRRFRIGPCSHGLPGAGSERTLER